MENVQQSTGLILKTPPAHTDTHTHTHRHLYRHTGAHTHTQTHRETHRHPYRHTGAHTHTDSYNNPSICTKRSILSSLKIDSEYFTLTKCYFALPMHLPVCLPVLETPGAGSHPMWMSHHLPPADLSTVCRLCPRYFSQCRQLF